MLVSVLQSTVRVRMRTAMFCSISFSMNGLEFVILNKKGRQLVVKHEGGYRRCEYLHGEYHDADTPAVDELIVPFLIDLGDDFGREVAWRATHRLSHQEQKQD